MLQCTDDGQNALKWGLKTLGLDQTAIHKKLWQVVASLRNSFDLLMRFVHDFIVSHLVPRDRVVDYSVAFGFWVDLGVEADAAERLADLGLLWHEGKLVFDRAALLTKDVIVEAVHCFKSVLRLKGFSDSRWVTMGGSCRTLLAARQLGLDEMVRIIRAQKDTSDYYIHGFAELVGDVGVYCAVSALVCNVPDALLLELLEDSRLAIRVSAVRAAVDEEVAWLRGVSLWT